MRPGQDLDRLGQLRVAGHGAVVVAVRPHEIRPDLGVTGVRLGPRRRVAPPVPAYGERVDRVHLVPSGHQGSDQQSAVRLDADDDLGRIRGVVADQGMELSHAVDPLRDPALGEDRAGLVHDADVVMGLGPVHPDEDHCAASSPRPTREPEESSGALMDQCSRHDIPPAVRALLTEQRGHDLEVEL